MEWNMNHVKVESNALEVWCVVLGILSLSGMFFGAFGILGLILCMVATKKGRYGTPILWGRVLSVIGIVVAIGMCFCWNGERKQNVEEAFAKGVEYGLATYNGTANDLDMEKAVENDVEVQVKKETSNDGSSVFLNPGEIVFDGKLLSVPCTFADLKDTFGVTSANLTENGETSSYVILHGNVDVENDSGFGLVAYVNCTSEDSTEQIDAASVTSLVFKDPQVSYEYLGGITCGMSLQDVRERMMGIPYEIFEYEEDGIIALRYECLSADGKGEYSPFLMFDMYTQTLMGVKMRYYRNEN